MQTSLTMSRRSTLRNSLVEVKVVEVREVEMNLLKMMKRFVDIKTKWSKK